MRPPVLALSCLVLGCSAATPPPPPRAAAPPAMVETAPSTTTTQIRSTTTAPSSTAPPPPVAVHVDHHGLDGAADLRVSATLWIEGRGEVWAMDPETELFPASNQKLLAAAPPAMVETAPSTTTTQIRSTTAAPSSTAPPPPVAVHVDHHGLDGAADLRVSATLWIEGRGEVWAIDPETELFPASNQKLLAAAGAYELLDLDHRFATTVVAKERNGAAELYLVAGGDPELGSAELSVLARTSVAALAGLPVRSVHVDATRFEPHRRAPGWQDWHIPTYTGPLSAFLVEDNRWSTAPDFLSDPAVGNMRRFVELLLGAGVAIAEPEPTHATPPPEHRILARHESRPVGELLVTMLHRSDNEIAESIVREIDVLRGGTGSTRAGLEHIVGRLGRAGVRVGGTNGDGSGLSRANRRSARQWQAFLRDIRRRPWFPDFEAALPVAGRSGTLANRLGGPTTAGAVRAKTGTIIGGRSLTGYLTTAAGPGIFSITVNGDRSSDALQAIDDLVVEFTRVD